MLRSVRVDVKSTHRIYDNHRVIDRTILPFLQIESNGTIKLLNILPTIFNVLNTGGILIVDEIENGLHPTVVKSMIDLFYNPKTNPFNAQLICTTHNVQLIDTAVQRDEVWIIAMTSSYIKARTARLTLRYVSRTRPSGLIKTNCATYIKRANQM